MEPNRVPPKSPRGWFIGKWWRQYREYSKLVQTPGFIPKISRSFSKVFRWICMFWAYAQIGRITVVGAENLKASGHIIFCPNHSSLCDGFLVYPLMELGTRYMGAYEVMPGLRGILIGSVGGFAVDRTQGNTVIEPAVQILVSGAHLVMFPEGKISPTGEYLRFKSGAARIALAAWDKLDRTERVGIVPIQICFNKRHSPSGATTFPHMGLKWRAGATVTIGKPIYLDELDSLDPHAITQRLKTAVMSVPCATAPGEKEQQ